VPTWNYASVHAYGVARAIADKDWLNDLLRRLSERHEAREAAPWRMQDQPAPFLDGMLGGIIGFEIAVSRLEGKFKLSQNRPATDRPRIVAALEARDDADSHGVARLMRERCTIGLAWFFSPMRHGNASASSGIEGAPEVASYLMLARAPLRPGSREQPPRREQSAASEFLVAVAGHAAVGSDPPASGKGAGSGEVGVAASSERIDRCLGISGATPLAASPARIMRSDWPRRSRARARPRRIGASSTRPDAR
jgi:hypothetical protein